MTTLDIRPIAGALGAEIHGIDLSSALDGETVAAVRRALLDHVVIFFRDQDLPPERFLAFARRLGTPVEYPLVKGIDGYPEIIRVAKLEHETVNFGGIWHSDTTYLETPADGHDAGGARGAAGRRRYALRQHVSRLRGAVGRHEAAARRLEGGQHLAQGRCDARPARTASSRTRRRSRARSSIAEHPVVRTHPETGRKALYVNVAHTVRFAGMTEAESAPILRYLFRHQVQPEFTCRFAWRVGSLAFWDNRAAQHNPVNDYHGYRRVMHRITLAGDRPR